MLTDRQAQLLRLVVENHIETAEPVGSKFLVEQEGLSVSGATVRNDLRDLEIAGFLTHPHTSAGRVPTEAGYRYYVEHMMTPQKLRKQIKDQCDALFSEAGSSGAGLKRVAKHLTDYAQNAIIIAFGTESVYYTGLSCLFSQPELKEYGQSVSVSAMFDQCEERLPELEEKMTHDVDIFIGTQNPLGSFCGTVAVKAADDVLVAFVGPLRMDYAKSVGLAIHLQSLLST